MYRGWKTNLMSLLWQGFGKTFFFISIFKFLFVVYACFACVGIYVPTETRRGIGTGVKDACELLFGFWESNLHPLSEQLELLM